MTAASELRVTTGDEFQGSYATLGAALDAALRVRVQLLPASDARFGIGRGPVTTLDEERGIEDGPGWWAARDAIEAAEEGAERPATRQLRTAYRVAAEEDGGRWSPPPPARAARSTPSTRPCSVGTIWLARCRTARSDY